MSLFTRFAGATFALAATATLVTATTAQARQHHAQPVTVQMSADALTDPDAKLCLPRGLVDTSKNPDQPNTLCQTRDEWAAQGVTIVAKK
jgi:hypothetical protein